MITFDSVENTLNKWRSEFRHGSFSYSDGSPGFRAAVSGHFGKTGLKNYGVYVIRQREPEQIIYIGKGGTINSDGQYKGQDIPGRLCNTRGKELGEDISAEQWFQKLAQEFGSFEVEYIIVERPVSPGYVEAELLQTYLAEHGRLPYRNNCL